MPGMDSLKYNEYYAHPRNAFWKLMFDILQTNFSSDYNKKQKLLFDNKIALWDSLASCYREGSLDSDIIEEKPNDIQAFLNTHPKITHIAFNGKSSQHFFNRYIKGITLPTVTLPSTSPAYVISYEKKLNEWKVIKDFI